MKLGSFWGQWREEAGQEFIAVGAAHTHAICCVSYVMLCLAVVRLSETGPPVLPWGHGLGTGDIPPDAIHGRSPQAAPDPSGCTRVQQGRLR